MTHIRIATGLAAERLANFTICTVSATVRHTVVHIVNATAQSSYTCRNKRSAAMIIIMYLDCSINTLTHDWSV